MAPSQLYLRVCFEHGKVQLYVIAEHIFWLGWRHHGFTPELTGTDFKNLFKVPNITSVIRVVQLILLHLRVVKNSDSMRCWNSK